MEDLSGYLNDDIGIVFSFVTKAFNALDAGKPFASIRRPDYASEVEQEFGPELMENAVVNGDEYREEISHYFRNWDKERVSEMDYLILQLALAEALTFPLIPTTVTINEYLNLAHVYGTHNSHSFINGILHEMFGNLKQEGRILGE